MRRSDFYRGEHFGAGTRRVTEAVGRISRPAWMALLVLLSAVVTLVLLRSGRSSYQAVQTTASTLPSCFVFGSCAADNATATTVGNVATPTSSGPTTTAAAGIAAATTSTVAVVLVDGQYSITARITQGDCSANNFTATVRTTGTGTGRRVTLSAGGRSFSSALSPSYGFSFGNHTSDGTDTVSGAFNVSAKPITISASETVTLPDGATCKATWTGRRVG